MSPTASSWNSFERLARTLPIKRDIRADLHDPKARLSATQESQAEIRLRLDQLEARMDRMESGSTWWTA